MVHPFDDREVVREALEMIPMIPALGDRRTSWAGRWAGRGRRRRRPGRRTSTPARPSPAGSSSPWSASASTATTTPAARTRCSAAARPARRPSSCDDPVVALGRLARHVVDRLDATVLALTGSQGKTGTKDYLAQLLAGDGATVATLGNHNNELGVPLTVLAADSETRYLVVEMGARGVGHIAYLCELAPPQVAAVINVGTAHIGEFGSREAIARAKGEIVEALPVNGIAVLNAADDLVAAMAAAPMPASSPSAGAATSSARERRGRRPRPAVLRAGSRRGSGTRSRCATAARTRSRTPWPPPPWRSRSASPLEQVATGLSAAAGLVAEADGDARALRRPGRDQRLLQRQPRVDDAPRSRRSR